MTAIVTPVLIRNFDSVLILFALLGRDLHVLQANGIDVACVIGDVAAILHDSITQSAGLLVQEILQLDQDRLGRVT